MLHSLNKIHKHKTKKQCHLYNWRNNWFWNKLEVDTYSANLKSYHSGFFNENLYHSRKVYSQSCRCPTNRNNNTLSSHNNNKNIILLSYNNPHEVNITRPNTNDKIKKILSKCKADYSSQLNKLHLNERENNTGSIFSLDNIIKTQSGGNIYRSLFYNNSDQDISTVIHRKSLH